MSVTASASDNIGVTNIEFYENGTLVYASNVVPYSLNWNTTATADGTYILTAKAYDSAGNVGQSSAVSITVNNSVSLTIAPTVTVTSPTSNATVSGTVTVNASASDTVGISKVEFYVNGVLKSSKTSSPYSFNWNTTNLVNSTYSLSAKAYDLKGNSGDAAPVSVKVSNKVLLGKKK